MISHLISGLETHIILKQTYQAYALTARHGYRILSNQNKVKTFGLVLTSHICHFAKKSKQHLKKTKVMDKKPVKHDLAVTPIFVGEAVAVT